MPAARIPMKKIIEVLCLRYETQLSHEKIARACQLSRGAVSRYVSLARTRGVTWPESFVKLPDGCASGVFECAALQRKA